MGTLRYESLWDTYIALAVRASKNGDHARAERLMNTAFGDAEDFNELDERLVWLAHSLAGQHCASGNYAGAERIYEQVIEAREKILGPDDPDSRNSIEKVAILLLHSKARASASNGSDSPPLCA